jgi:hypothetical protein
MNSSIPQQSGLWDFSEIEFEGVQKALLETERRCFHRVREICVGHLNDRDAKTSYETAHQILVLANDIKAVAQRREELIKEREQKKHS